MKKALQITLAGNLFTIEEDAYEKLHTYLNSITEYFSHIADSDDVVEDIEARIAEQLLEKIQHHNNIVTLIDVTHVMQSMGTIEEISGTTSEETTKFTHTEEATQTKKLYRSSDDVVVAGVASGLASYFGVDAFAMRIVFAIILFVTGGGFVFVYIAAALLIPQAKTATDKVKMRGGPVTLASFKENFSEQMKTVKENSEEILKPESPVRQNIEKVFYIVGRIIRKIVKITVKVIAAFLIIGALFASAIQIFAAGNLIFNYDSPYIDFPLTQVISQPLYFLFILIAFLLVFIPTFFIGSLGVMIIAGKSKVSGATAMILGGIWIIALILAGTLGIRTALDVRQKIMNLPEYQSATQEFVPAPFTAIELYGNNKVTYVESDTYKVTVNGKQIDIDSTVMTVENTILKISDKPSSEFCIICMGRDRLEIEIAAPNINSIRIEDAVDFKGVISKNESVKIMVHDVGFADVTVDTRNLTVDMKDASRLFMQGTTTDIIFIGKDAARFDGSDLMTTNATITLTDASRAHIETIGTLQITGADASRATYTGINPILNLEDGARVDNVSTSTKKAVDLSNNNLFSE